MLRLNRLAAQRLQTKKKSPANWPSSQRQLVSKEADQPASWPREEDRPCRSKLSMATVGFNQGQILTPRILKASIKQDTSNKQAQVKEETVKKRKQQARNRKKQVMMKKSKVKGP